MFYHSEGEDARVEYKIVSGKDEDIEAARERFARMLTDTFEGYDISVSY